MALTPSMQLQNLARHPVPVWMTNATSEDPQLGCHQKNLFKNFQVACDVEFKGFEVLLFPFCN